MNIIWKIAPVKTGSWPTAFYEGGQYCASIECKDDYTPTDNHAPLQLVIADYSWKPHWRRAPFPQKYATLDEAKAGLLKILAEHPQLVPKPPVLCKYCGAETRMMMTKLCDNCWEIERRVASDPALAAKILLAHRNGDTHS